MKILIISQYFWPENFKINDIAIGLKEKGHEISVLTGIPNYPNGIFFEGYDSNSKDEVWNGMKIYRSKLIPRGKGGIKLFLNYISFALFASVKGRHLKEKYDRILVYEPSPITVGIPAIFTGRKQKIPYYFWVQDLWPESLTAAGGINNKLVLSFFDKITRWIYNNAEKVLVQSRGFKTYILKQKISEDKIIFYPNTTENYYQPKKEVILYKEKMPKGFTITFAGNLGEAQSLNTLLTAAKIIKEKKYNDIKWVFLGDGRQKTEMEKFILNNKLLDTVFLLGSFPGEEMPNFFACSDVLIASLKKDKIFALTIPSKIQSYLACRKPILASLDGEGAQIVNEAKAGFSSPAENADLLVENVIKMYNTTFEEREMMGENALVYFQKEFEREMLLNKLISILEKN